MEASANLLKNQKIHLSPCFTGHIPLDVDVSPHDNSKTKKEGVSRTYKGVDGYSPIYAYIGEEGYVANVELREGSCHSQSEGTLDFLSSTIRMAKTISPTKLLARMDSGNDALDNIKLFDKEKVDYIIKRNLRNESLDKWLSMAKDEGEPSEPREGQTVYTGSFFRDRGLDKPLRMVYRIIERTSHANGQIYLTPEIEVDMWWTSIENSEEDIIRLYKEHATCEQFHSEMKTDIGLERFPSSHFDTNAGIMKLAGLAFNILRMIGQSAISNGNKFSRHDVRRLRIKTVIQDMIFIACRVISHARQKFLNLGRSNIWRFAFVRVYNAFA
jgi:hypothetical protein